MRIYIAASLTMREHAIAAGERIRRETDHTVECRWFNESLGSEDSGFLAGRASDNLADIRDADMIVRFSDAEVVSGLAGSIDRRLATGGRHFECGYAYALGKAVVVVGGRQNIFDWLPDITHAADVGQLLSLL